MDPDPDADPDPSIFIIDLQDARKTSFFRGKKSKRSHKTVEIKVFLTIFA
jgi:hypothetical protein